jgi:hypothetical protein
VNPVNERGIALILTLILTAAASALAGSLMYLSQTETYATSNYRVMTQARYGAESGIHKAINFLLNTYATPGTVADPLANYNRTVSPVTYDGQPSSCQPMTTSNRTTRWRRWLRSLPRTPPVP